MKNNYFNGIKFGLGFLTIIGLVFGIVYAVGFHTANEIVSGTFIGNYTFNGNVNFSDAKIMGLSSNPTQFSFTNQYNVSRNTLITSEIIQILGILDSSSVISINGTNNPQYRICIDSTCSSNPFWINITSNFNKNSYLQVRMNSSNSFSSEENLTLTIGSVDSDWVIKTSIPQYFSSGIGTSDYAGAVAKCSSLGSWHLGSIDERNTFDTSGNGGNPSCCLGVNSCSSSGIWVEAGWGTCGTGYGFICVKD